MYPDEEMKVIFIENADKKLRKESWPSTATDALRGLLNRKETQETQERKLA